MDSTKVIEIFKKSTPSGSFLFAHNFFFPFFSRFTLRVPSFYGLFPMRPLFIRLHATVFN